MFADIRGVCAAGVLFVVVAGTGCGGKPVSVEGRVFLDGEPVEGAMVSFIPEKGERSANGLTDADGVFQLTTFNTGDGAVPGTYKVTVEKLRAQVIRGEGSGRPNDPMIMRKAMEDFSKNAQKEKVKGPTSSLPPKYANAETTPLKYTIPYSGQIKIELKSTGGT